MTQRSANRSDGAEGVHNETLAKVTSAALRFALGCGRVEN